jgi:archaetidylinositol phosphate synthase
MLSITAEGSTLMDQQRQAKRILDTLTGPLEKPLLIKMAQALPLWVTSDRLTVLGIIAGFVVAFGFIALWASPWWIMLSNAGFVIHWWADSLDGTVARVRQLEREQYGHFVDHICDALAIVLICVGLGLSPLVHTGIALAVAIGYLLMNVYAHIVSYVAHVFKISYGRFGPTELRIIFMIGTTVFAFWNPVLFHIESTKFRMADIIALAVAVILVLIFIVSALQKAVQLDKADRAKWGQPKP